MAYKVRFRYREKDPIQTVYILVPQINKDNPLTYWLNFGLDLKKNIIEVEKFGEIIK